MIAALATILAAFAGDLERPARPEPVAGECTSSIPLRIGEPPPPELIDPVSGLVRCAAIAEPVSSIAYYLATEKHRNGLEALHVVDLRLIAIERDRYKTLYLDSVAVPWYETGTAQRWAGRVETLIAIGLAVAVVNIGPGAK